MVRLHLPPLRACVSGPGVSAPVLRPELDHLARQLDQTLLVLGARLQRVLTALALTLDARRAVNDRLSSLPGHPPTEAVDVAVFENSAAQCREIVRSLESA